MKIMYVVYECFPFFKTGGLADVAYAFPKALAERPNNEVTVVMPFLDAIPKKYKEKMEIDLVFSSFFDGCNYKIIVKKLKLNKVTYLFIETDNKDNYSNCYSHNVLPSSYVFFSKAIIELIINNHYTPNVLHLNDWHTALTAYLLKKDFRLSSKRIKSVYTIHNLQYQGIFDKRSILQYLSIVDESDFNHFNNHSLVNFMKIGIIYSDIVVTVSPTYMIEIQMQEFGMGLNNVLLENNYKLHGILNGLDYKLFNPDTDPNLCANFNEENWQVKRHLNKRRFLSEELPKMFKENFLLGLVTRLADQKGVDIFLSSVKTLLENNDLNIVILGKGDPYYESQFAFLEKQYPNNFKAYLSFDEFLARKIYASVDALLVPSYFEPCGLTQMIAMRYGAVPIVRKTGGLADTVVPYYDKHGCGFLFNEYSPHELIQAVKTAKQIFYQDKGGWNRFVCNGLKLRFDWNKIVDQYLNLYLK